jgi:ribonuclease HII
VDEAGRGSLAGPVVAGAVLFSPGFPFARNLPGLDDSKKLTPARRDVMAAGIRRHALAVGLGLAWQEEVDSVNVLNATFRAMSRAVLALAAALSSIPAPLPGLRIDGDHAIPIEQWRLCRDLPPTSPVCADQAAGLGLLPPFADPLPPLPPQETLVNGDALCPSISAASILAKTARDTLLIRLDPFFPGYGFARHKGYGTREHQKALARLGPCALHRHTFRKVRPEERQAPLPCPARSLMI